MSLNFSDFIMSISKTECLIASVYSVATGDQKFGSCVHCISPRSNSETPTQ